MRYAIRPSLWQAIKRDEEKNKKIPSLPLAVERVVDPLASGI